MDVSPEVEEILRQVKTLRANRQRRLERDLHYIDAAYDRQLRRVESSAIWNRSSCTCYSRRPFSAQRFCRRRFRWLQRRLGL
ncbi:MAG: hypothetical protein AAGD11_18045 [Planctomycetota bacterium]